MDMSILRTQNDFCFTVYDFSMKATLQIVKKVQAFHIFDSELALLRHPVYGTFTSVDRMKSRYMIQNLFKSLIYSMMLVLKNCASTDSNYIRFVRIFRVHLKNYIYMYTNIVDVLLLNSHPTFLAQPFQFDGYELSIEINKPPSCAIRVEFERRFNLLNSNIDLMVDDRLLEMVRSYQFCNLLLN